MVTAHIINSKIKIDTVIPYDVIISHEHIQRYYNDVIEDIEKYTSGCRIVLKPNAHTTKSMRKRTIVQWLILDIAEMEEEGKY